MLKRIIFDLDNTLIMWKDEYIKALEKTIKRFNLNLDANYINSLIENYEKENNYYEKNKFINYINKYSEIKIDENFTNEFLYNIGFCAEIDEKTINTLKYLKEKYELVVLTNWFLKPQIERLKTAKIYEFFNEVIGGEESLKPNKENFIKACGNHKIEECVMIGDNYQIDIIGAKNTGLNVIYFNNKNKQDNKLKLIEIDTLEQLKSIL